MAPQHVHDLHVALKLPDRSAENTRELETLDEGATSPSDREGEWRVECTPTDLVSQDSKAPNDAEIE